MSLASKYVVPLCYLQPNFKNFVIVFNYVTWLSPRILIVTVLFYNWTNIINEILHIASYKFSIQRISTNYRCNFTGYKPADFDQTIDITWQKLLTKHRFTSNPRLLACQFTNGWIKFIATSIKVLTILDLVTHFNSRNCHLFSLVIDHNFIFCRDMFSWLQTIWWNF